MCAFNRKQHVYVLSIHVHEKELEYTQLLSDRSTCHVGVVEVNARFIAFEKSG